MRLTVFRNPASSDIQDDLDLDELKKLVSELLDELEPTGNLLGFIVGID